MRLANIMPRANCTRFKTELNWHAFVQMQDSPVSCAVPPMGLAWLHHEAPLPYPLHISTPLYSTQVRHGQCYNSL